MRNLKMLTMVSLLSALPAIGSANVAMAKTAPDFTFEIPAGDGVRTTMYSGFFLDLELNSGVESPLTVFLAGDGYNTMRALGTYSCESLDMRWDTISYNNSLVDVYDLDSFDYIPFDNLSAEILIASIDFCE